MRTQCDCVFANVTLTDSLIEYNSWSGYCFPPVNSQHQTLLFQECGLTLSKYSALD